MPTAAEFRSAASELQAVMDAIPQLSSALDGLREDSGLVGQFRVRTTFEGVVDEALGVVSGCCGALSAAMGDLEWRANECDAYAAAVRRWSRAQRVAPDSTPMPLRRYAWIDV